MRRIEAGHHGKVYVASCCHGFQDPSQVYAADLIHHHGRRDNHIGAGADDGLEDVYRGVHGHDAKAALANIPLMKL